MFDSSEGEEPALRVVGLRYASPDFELGPVDFQLRRGETLTVFGPNGAGKSTLLRLLAGLEATAGGRIWLDGREITRTPSHRRAVGMVFQDLALFPQLSVRQNLAYGPRAHGWSVDEIAARVEDLLQDFQLGELAERTPAHLSGGEQQRVALARALAPHPRLLLFDEPLSSADRDLRRSLHRLIRKRVATDGLVAVYVTHDLEEGSAIASRMAFLREGRWVREDDADAVRASPRSRFVAGFLGLNVHSNASGWVATDPSKTELVAPGSPESIEGVVEGFRQEGQMVLVEVRLMGSAAPSPSTVRSLQWSPSHRVRVGELVGLRFREEIALSEE